MLFTQVADGSILFIIYNHCSVLLCQDLSLSTNPHRSWFRAEKCRNDKVQKIQEHSDIFLQYHNLERGGSLSVRCKKFHSLLTTPAISSIFLGYVVRSSDRGLRVEQPRQDRLHHRHLWPHSRPLHPGDAGWRGSTGPQLVRDPHTGCHKAVNWRH